MRSWLFRFLLGLLLFLEAAGGLFVALGLAAGSEFLGAIALAPTMAVLPIVVAALCVLAAVGMWQRTRWGRVFTGIIEALIFVSGALGLVYGGHLILWLAIAAGAAGLLLLVWSAA